MSVWVVPTCPLIEALLDLPEARADHRLAGLGRRLPACPRFDRSDPLSLRIEKIDIEVAEVPNCEMGQRETHGQLFQLIKLWIAVVVLSLTADDSRCQEIWYSETGGGFGFFHSVSNGLCFNVRITEPYTSEFLASLQTQGELHEFELGDATQKTFAFCEVGANPFMPPPKLDQYSCGLLVEGREYSGFFELSDSAKTNLVGGGAEFKLLSSVEGELGGSLIVSQIPMIRVQTNGPNNKITWGSDGQCIIQMTTSLREPVEWQNLTNIVWKDAENIAVHPRTNGAFFYRLGWYVLSH